MGPVGRRDRRRVRSALSQVQMMDTREEIWSTGIVRLRSNNAPRPDGLIIRAREPFSLDTVFPYQKSNCALILKNRADMIDNGLRYVAP